jgi:hypothetical protein
MWIAARLLVATLSTGLLLSCGLPGQSETCSTSDELDLIRTAAVQNEWLIQELESQVQAQDDAFSRAQSEVDQMNSQLAVDRANATAACSTQLINRSDCVRLILSNQRRQLYPNLSSQEQFVNERREAIREDLRARVQYEIEDIVLRSRNDDTGAPNCQATLHALVPAPLNSTAEATPTAEARKRVDYTMERTASGELMGTVSLNDGIGVSN